MWFRGSFQTLLWLLVEPNLFSLFSKSFSSGLLLGGISFSPALVTLTSLSNSYLHRHLHNSLPALARRVHSFSLLLVTPARQIYQVMYIPTSPLSADTTHGFGCEGQASRFLSFAGNKL